MNHPHKRPNQHQHHNHQQNPQQVKKFRVHNDKQAELYVFPHSIYDKPFPDFKQPVEIGNFFSEKRKIDLESREIMDKNPKGFKYLSLPEDCTDCNFDLKLGLEKFVPHIPHQHGIDTLLQFLLKNKTRLTSNSANPVLKPFKADFICWRGLVSTLANAPYENFKDLMFGVILYKGTYYMCEIETEAQKFERDNMDEKGKSFTYWGHKFETYITSDLADEKPSDALEDAPDPENNFSSVIGTSLSGHNLLYAAEIDCCITPNHTGLNNYSEIKTHQGESVNDINRIVHRNFKFLKWWIQSFLVNIQTLTVGLRDQTGIVKKVINYNINEIAKPRGDKPWKETICFNFLKSVLDFIKYFCVQEKELYVVYRGRRANSLNFSRIEHDSDLYKQHYFLRDWFVDAV